MNIKKLLAAPLALLMSTGVFAADVPEGLQSVLNQYFPPGAIDEVNTSVLPGFHEIVAGTKIYYISSDGKYVINGKIIDIARRADIAEERLNGLRKTALDKLSESEMISYGDAPADHTVTVFTDVDCGYCQKFHDELQSYLDAGLRVRYILYPRTPPGSASFRKAVGVWCADDRKEALSLAKSRQPIDQKSCANPVAANQDAGADFGITGTPTIVLPNGEVIPGYVPASRLAPIVKEAARG
ncbi:MAG: DsbC family protein [Gammaproteobacteria bacterium]